MLPWAGSFVCELERSEVRVRRVVAMAGGAGNSGEWEIRSFFDFT